jgi:quercetin dioxygenase-like cupin family protein
MKRTCAMRRRAVIGAWLAINALVCGVTPAAIKTADKGLQIEVTSASSRTINAGPATNFTGAAQVEQLFAAQGARGFSGGVVTFKPGARSRWHTHPRGQILIITAGTGWVQPWGGSVREIKAGDVVWIPPGVKHWHGATASTPMSHVALQEPLKGDAVDWLEPVTDTQYASAAPAGSP